MHFNIFLGTSYFEQTFCMNQIENLNVLYKYCKSFLNVLRIHTFQSSCCTTARAEFLISIQRFLATTAAKISWVSTTLNASRNWALRSISLTDHIVVDGIVGIIPSEELPFTTVLNRCLTLNLCSSDELIIYPSHNVLLGVHSNFNVVSLVNIWHKMRQEADLLASLVVRILDR